MFCTQCGKEIPADAVFCSHCGAKVSKSIKESVTREPKPSQISVSQVSISQTLKKAKVGEHTIEAYAQPLPGGIKFYVIYDGDEMASKTINLLLGPFGLMGKKEVEFKVTEERKKVHYKAKFSVGMAGTPGAELFRNGEKIP